MTSCIQIYDVIVTKLYIFHFRAKYSVFDFLILHRILCQFCISMIGCNRIYYLYLPNFRTSPYRIVVLYRIVSYRIVSYLYRICIVFVSRVWSWMNEKFACMYDDRRHFFGRCCTCKLILSIKNVSSERKLR